MKTYKQLINEDSDKKIDKEKLKELGNRITRQLLWAELGTILGDKFTIKADVVPLGSGPAIHFSVLGEKNPAHIVNNVLASFWMEKITSSPVEWTPSDLQTKKLGFTAITAETPEQATKELIAKFKTIKSELLKANDYYKLKK